MLGQSTEKDAGNNGKKLPNFKMWIQPPVVSDDSKA